MKDIAHITVALKLKESKLLVLVCLLQTSCVTGRRRTKKVSEVITA